MGQVMYHIFKTILNIFKKKHGEKTDNPLITIYENKIKNRITFEIKTGYYLEIVTAETMKLLGSTKSNYLKNILKTFDSGFSYIEVWFTDQNSKQLEIKDKINITLVIN